MISEIDRQHLRRCVELAREAMDAGDEPFGSLLVGGDGRVLREDRNRAIAEEATRHPEFELARWAGANLSAAERAAATVYTSTEHCPMCAAAAGWVGIGRIVYASSSEQLGQWLGELGAAAPPVMPLPIQAIAPGIEVEGPDPTLADALRTLHQENHRSRAART